MNGPDSGCSEQCKVLPSACGAQKAEAQITVKPVDIVILIDNSEHVRRDQGRRDQHQQELRGYHRGQRPGLPGDHGVGLRQQSCRTGSASRRRSATSRPAAAPTRPPSRINNPGKFYHYSATILSLDAACKAISTFDGAVKDTYGFAPMGWKTWLREDALKVFLVITDDRMSCSVGGKSYNDGNAVNAAATAAAAYDTALLAKSPLHFGTPAAAD